MVHGVTVSPSAPPGVRLCNRGHVYAAYLPRCPWCMASATAALGRRGLAWPGALPIPKRKGA
jgi:hypothetical protein